MDLVSGGNFKSITSASRSSADFEVLILLFRYLIFWCVIDTEIDGNMVDPCIKLALSVETGQSSIDFKKHILGNIKCIFMLCSVSLAN